jgi:uncharacterized membrane protein
MNRGLRAIKYARGSGQAVGQCATILDERYAKGDLTREEYGRLKIEISGA